MATISNYKGDLFPISETTYFVTATDKVLSDWGHSRISPYYITLNFPSYGTFF